MRTGTILRLAIAPTIPHIRFAFRSTLLYRPLPARKGRLLAAGQSQSACRRVLGGRGSAAGRRPRTDPRRREKLRGRADENIVLDDGAVLVRPVVVAHDRAGTDVDVAADVAIAYVGEMIGLGTRAYAARLHFHEVADVHFCGESRARARADARVRTDAAARADVGVLQVAKGFDARARCDHHVFQHAVRADRHAVAELNLALEYAVDVDRHVAAAGEGSAHVAARRIGERHALFHERIGELALVDALQLGELAAAVHAECLPRRAGLDGRHRYGLLRPQRDDIGKVVLLLGVVVLQLREPGLELLRRRHDDAGVDLAQRALPRVGVFLFDDRHYFLSVSQDAPVSGGTVECRRQKAKPLPRRLDQLLQRLGAYQRDVPVEHESRPALVEMRGGLHHRMTRAELRFLHDPDGAVLPHGLAHVLASVTIDDADHFRRELLRGIENVREHGPARKAVQHLGRARMHALARTRGENNDIHKEAERI